MFELGIIEEYRLRASLAGAEVAITEWFPVGTKLMPLVFACAERLKHLAICATTFSAVQQLAAAATDPGACVDSRL